LDAARRGVLAAAVVATVLAPPAASAQGAPRIGLALSGGGARGAAHIGVLKVLEELRVPVACVAGTSFGAIVGGAYASGVAPRDLEQVLRDTDWDQVFTDQPPRAEVSPRRKEDDYKALFDFELGWKDNKPQLPKGLIAGVSIESFLRKLTATAAVGDFQRLPIPFRAVATDIETGQAVVLGTGSVPFAMRASMAIPGFVSPVEIDGHLLVDGGISDNLPIDVVRELCSPDVIIAVDISTPPLRRDQIGSALSIVTQMVNLLGKAAVDQQLASLDPGKDVLIRPQLGDITAGSFPRSLEAVALGEQAARAMTAQLQHYSLPVAEYADLRRAQTAATVGLEPVDEVRIEGLQRTNPEALQGLVQVEPHQPLTEEAIAGDLRRIYGRGDYESVDYRLLQEPGKRVLLYEPQEKSWGPDYLRFGLGLATDFSGQDQFNALASYRRTWLNRLGGEWELDGQVGHNAYLFTEFYQPLNLRGNWFVAPYAKFDQDSRAVFLDVDRVADYQVREQRAGLDAGAVAGTFGEARLGLIARRVHARVDTGSPLLPNVDVNASGYRALLTADQYDRRYFPRDGYFAQASLFGTSHALGAEQDYQRGELKTGVAFSEGKHALWLTLYAGSDFHSNAPAYEAFTLGGPLRMSGYQIDELAGQRMVFARAMYYNRRLKLPDLLGSGVFVGTSLETASLGGSRLPGSPTGTLWSGSVFLSADTVLGPFYAGVGAAPGGRYTAYLLLGPPP
jgi:NTE family protein